MNTLKTLFKKTIDRKNNKGLLEYKQCDCSHCEKETCKKMEKCKECGNKTVCKECYDDGKILCKTCDDALIKQYSEMVEQNKEDQYDFLM